MKKNAFVLVGVGLIVIGSVRLFDIRLGRRLKWQRLVGGAKERQRRFEHCGIIRVEGGCFLSKSGVHKFFPYKSIILLRGTLGSEGSETSLATKKGLLLGLGR